MTTVYEGPKRQMLIAPRNAISQKLHTIHQTTVYSPDWFPTARFQQEMKAKSKTVSILH